MRKVVSGAAASAGLSFALRLCRVVTLLERPVDLEEHLLLALGERRVAGDRGDEIGGVVALVEYARPDVERLRRDPQPASDALEDLGRRLAQAAFDLAEVRVRDARELAQLAQRQARVAPLVADEPAEIVEPRFERVQRLVLHPAVPATRRSAITRSMTSITTWIRLRRSESSRSNCCSDSSVALSSSSETPGSFASVLSITRSSRPSGQCSSITGGSVTGAPRVLVIDERP